MPLLCGALMAVSFLSCKKDEPVPPVTTEDSRIYAKTENPLGQTVKAWAEVRTRFQFTQTCAEAMALGVITIPGQDQSMVFLNGNIINQGTANIIIGHDKSIFVPVAESNYSDPTCANFHFFKTPTQSVEDFLKSTVATIMSGVDNHKVTLDGIDIASVRSYRYQTNLIAANPTTDIRDCGLLCYPPGAVQTLTEGYFLVIKPLSIGTHTLVLYAKDTVFNIEFSSSFNINVI